MDRKALPVWIVRAVLSLGLSLLVTACEKAPAPATPSVEAPLELGKPTSSPVAQGTPALLLVKVWNRGEEDVITSLTASCGCTQVADKPDALQEGSLLPKGESLLEFRVNTEDRESPITGTIILQTARGNQATVDYEVAFTAGIEVEPGPIILEAAPGQLQQRTLWLRFPPGAEGSSIKEVTTKDARLQAAAHANPAKAGEWLIDLSWQPGPEAKAFKEDLLVTTDFQEKQITIPVQANLKRYLTIEPATWVLGDIHQNGTQKLTFTLSASDGRAFQVVEWKVLPPIKARSDAKDQPSAAHLTFQVEVAVEDFRNAMESKGAVKQGVPNIAYLELQTDHPLAPIVKVPLIAIAP